MGSEFKEPEGYWGGLPSIERDPNRSFLNYLGFGNHFYFIDACRNTIRSGEVSPGSLGWTRDVIQNGETRVFTLFSTQRGSVADTESGFAPALVDGLAGRSRAKVRDGLRMVVTFESLCRYLEKTLQQEIQAEPGGGPGRILEIEPIPSYRCDVQVDGADSGDVFTLEVRNALSQTVVGPTPFQGVHTDFTQGPDDYYVRVTNPQCEIVPASPLFADLYEDCVVNFRKREGGPGRGVSCATATGTSGRYAERPFQQSRCCSKRCDRGNRRGDRAIQWNSGRGGIRGKPHRTRLDLCPEKNFPSETWRADFHERGGAQFDAGA